MKPLLLLCLLVATPGYAGDYCSEDFKSVVAIHAAVTPKDPCTVEWAEYILSHCDNGGYTRRDGTKCDVCYEAEDMVVKKYGSRGKRDMLPNGWSKTSRNYK